MLLLLYELKQYELKYCEYELQTLRYNNLQSINLFRVAQKQYTYKELWEFIREGKGRGLKYIYLGFFFPHNNVENQCFCIFFNLDSGLYGIEKTYYSHDLCTCFQLYLKLMAKSVGDSQVDFFMECCVYRSYSQVSRFYLAERWRWCFNRYARILILRHVNNLPLAAYANTIRRPLLGKT